MVSLVLVVIVSTEGGKSCESVTFLAGKVGVVVVVAGSADVMKCKFSKLSSMECRRPFNVKD